MATKDDKLKRVRAKQGAGYVRPSSFYAIVETKVEEGIGDKKTIVDRSFVINGTSRHDAQLNASDFIAENKDSFKSAYVGIIRPFAS